MFKSWPSNPNLGEKTFAGESELDSCARPGTDGATGLSNKKEMLQMVIRDDKVCNTDFSENPKAFLGQEERCTRTPAFLLHSPRRVPSG